MRTFISLSLFCLVTMALGQEAVKPLKPVPVKDVTINDQFWAPKRKLWQEVTIPDCFAKFEKNGAIKNFDLISAGTTNIPHGGPAWYDGLVYEMIRGSADFLASAPDAELAGRLDGYIEKIVAAAEKDSDGYLNTWTQIKEPAHRWGLNEGNDVQQHDVYNAGAMVEAAVHYYRATGKTALLKTAARLANHMCNVMGPPPKKNVIPGHGLPEEALVKLYVLFRDTPGLKKDMPFKVVEANYLKLAEFWIENRGNHEGRTDFGVYDQDHKPVMEQHSIEGHAVRATLMCAGLSALAGVNGREDYSWAAERLWNSMTGRKMYITGGVGAAAGNEAFARNYVLPNNGHLETCAAVGSGFFSHNMSLLLADGKYADELERVLYNGVLCGVSLKGTTYTYQNPLEISKKHNRWPWHPCPCCPPMFLKMMGALPSFIYSLGEKSVYVNLFIGSTARFELNGTRMTIKQATRYPWDGNVTLSLDMSGSEKFDLLVRVPGWCEGESRESDLYTLTGRPPTGGMKIRINSRQVETPEVVRGYARLPNKWRNGDTIELAMEMPVREARAHSAVEADAGRVALTRGPLVYCVESVDNGDDARRLVLDDSTALGTEFQPDLLDGVMVIKGTVRASSSPEDKKLHPAELLAIPYFGYLNRGPAEVAVWLERKTKEVMVPPGQGLIRINADKVVGHVSRTMTGACLEDVNHEIYGGLYSQMLFGESFQEPPLALPMKDFLAYDGCWTPTNHEVRVEGADGPKLICRQPYFSEGDVSVEVMFTEKKEGNAGLLVRVVGPDVGSDRFYGYEASLDTAGRLVFGRHRYNWEPYRNVACNVPLNQWVKLTVRMTGNKFAILVDDKLITEYEDDSYGAVDSGLPGIRVWQRDARFRNLCIKGEGQIRYFPFEIEAQENIWGYGVSGMWRAFRRGNAEGYFSLKPEDPFAGRQSQQLEFKDGEGEIGIENQGLNRCGLSVVADKPYEGYVVARATVPGDLIAALESRDGKTIYAEQRVSVTNAGWEKISFVLTPNASDKECRFALKLRQAVSVTVGRAFLQPGEWGRFKNLPIRRDVAEAMIEQGLTVLRYGGSMINHREYRWKKMIGPPETRPPSRGSWYPYSSNGWGIFDFLNFCEQADFTGIPAVNMEETPQDMADFMDYVNGAKGNEWTRRRALDGHARPYELKILQLGNEEVIDERYWEKFKPLAEAIWARDPGVILVVGDFHYDQAFEDPYNVRGAAVRTLATHKKILDLARDHDREVWFDVHIASDSPPQPNGVPGIKSFAEHLSRLNPVARFKVVVFEFNANSHDLRRALSNAMAINQLERLGDIVRVACSANALQVYKQNDNGWDQGLLFMSPSQVWPQPPYFVTQMVSSNTLPLCVTAEVTSPDDALDVTAKKSVDGKTLVLQVANTKALPVPTRLAVSGFEPAGTLARVITLTGDLNAVNTPEQPDKIRPETREWDHRVMGGNAFYTFPPFSFTVIRFEP